MREWITGTGDTRLQGIYRGPDVLAHELLGHGYQMLKDNNQSEYDARRIGNKIIECIGEQPQRTYSGT